LGAALGGGGATVLYAVAEMCMGRYISDMLCNWPTTLYHFITGCI